MINAKYKKIFNKSFINLLLFLPFPIWLFYLLSVYPGILTQDSIDQWGQAMTFNFNNWHPIFHTLINWSLIQIYNSPATICIAQILSLALVNVYGFKVLTKTKSNKKYGILLLILITLLITINPINGYMVNTLWKDIFFSISFLLLELIYINVIINNPKITKTKYILYITTLFFVYNLRHNGPITTILFILFFYLSTKKLKTSFLLIIGLITLIFFYNSILLKSILKITKTEKPPITNIFIHYQIAILKNNGLMPEKAIKSLQLIDPKGELINNFSHYFMGYIYNSETINTNYIESHKKDILFNFIHSVAINPIIYFRELSKMNSIILSIKIPISGYLYVQPVPTSDFSNYLYLKDIYTKYNLKHNPILNTKLSNIIYEFTIKHKNIFWNLSILFYLDIIFLSVLAIKKIKFKYLTPILLIIIPVITTGIVVPAQDYRYFYILILSLPFIIFYSFLLLKNQSLILNRNKTIQS